MLERNQQLTSQLEELHKTLGPLRQTSYPVAITGLPTNLNDGAQANVVATLLTVQCAKGPFTLNNLNFSVSDSLSWSQQNCQDTTLSIFFPTFVVKKHYPGALGFVEFLQDFKNGSHVFNQYDFPEQHDQLADANIEAITVRYQFRGQDAVLQNNKLIQDTEDNIKEVLVEQQEVQRELAGEGQQTAPSFAIGSKTNKEATSIEIPRKIGQCWEEVGY